MKLLKTKAAQFGLISIVSQLIAFLIPLAIARFFSPELFGKYSLAIMTAMFLLAFFINSSQTPFIIYASQELKTSSKMNKSFSIKVAFNLFSVAIVGLILSLFNGPISKFIGMSPTEIYSLIFLFVGLLTRDFMTGFFLAKNERNKSALVGLTYSATTIGIITALLIFNSFNIKTLFLSYLISAIITLGLFARKKHLSLIFPIQIEKKRLLEFFHFTKWQIFGLTAASLINWGDNIVLRIFTTLKDIGIYNFGYRFFAGSLGMILLINTYFLPILSRKIKDRKYLKTYFDILRVRTLLLGSFILFIINIGISLFIYLFYSQEYISSISIIWILFPSLIFSLYYTFYIPFFNVKKKYKVLQIGNILQILLNLGLGFILVPIMGPMGAAVATTTGYLFKLILLETYFRKVLS